MKKGAITFLDAGVLWEPSMDSITDPAFQNFGKMLAEELTNTGLVALENTCFDAFHLSRLESLFGEFFQLPTEQKNLIQMKNYGRSWRGYFAAGEEFTAGMRDLKEGLYFGVDHSSSHPLVLSQQPMHGRNPTIPGKSGQSTQRMLDIHMKLSKVFSEKILKALFSGLGLNLQILESVLLPEPTELFRAFNYPKKSNHQNVGSKWGVGEHTDMGFLTLLIQCGNTQALEAKNRSGEWVQAPPRKGAVYLNIGDMLEYCTRGLLWATPHRVSESLHEDRISFPYFFDPAWTAQVPRISESELRGVGWTEDVFAGREQNVRWDNLNLHTLSDNTYGQFVWNKIRNVFPWLAGEAGNEIR
jgi:isopenicillin N synthase-like dioxygenase